MASNTAPRYVALRKTWHVKINTADADLTGGGTLGTLVTAGGNGTLIEQIRIKAEARTTRGMIRIFLYDGTNNNLFIEKLFSIKNPDSVQPTWVDIIPTGVLVIPTTWILKVSASTAAVFHVFAHGGDY
jgi:hypothetical protein